MLRVREMQAEDKLISEGQWHLTQAEQEERERKKRELAILRQKLKEDEQDTKALEAYHLPTCFLFSIP